MIEHKIRVKIVERLVKPEVMAKRVAWGRNLKVLKELELEFTDPNFWLSLKLSFGMIDGLAYFKTTMGRHELVRQWNMYLYQQAQEEEQAVQQMEILLDKNFNSETLEQSPLPPRETPVIWADTI